MSDDYPDDLLYSNEHEWARVAEKVIRVGITRFAVEQLGDVTQVELPDEGDKITKGEVFGSIESVKAVSDLYAPASGTVKLVNSPLHDSPEYVNEDPYDEGWLIEVEVSDPKELDELMNSGAYRGVRRGTGRLTPIRDPKSVPDPNSAPTGHREHVEAAGCEARLAVVEVHLSDSDNPSLLHPTDGLFGEPTLAGRTTPDLDKNQFGPLSGNEIHFTESAPIVLFDDDQTGTGKARSSESLGDLSHPSRPRSRHQTLSRWRASGCGDFSGSERPSNGCGRRSGSGSQN